MFFYLFVRVRTSFACMYVQRANDHNDTRARRNDKMMNTTTNNNVTINDNDFLNAIENMIENTLNEMINENVMIDFRDMMCDVSTTTFNTTRDDDNDEMTLCDMRVSCM
jgi:hypothetical protein